MLCFVAACNGDEVSLGAPEGTDETGDGGGGGDDDDGGPADTGGDDGGDDGEEGGSFGGDAGDPCTPGDVEACACDSAADDGTRLCDENGQWDACVCTPGFDCGNGFREPGEACDDGNAIDGDGCNVSCQPGGTIEWVAGYHSPLGDIAATGVAVDGAMEIVVVGHEDRSIEGTGLGSWIRRYDSAGSTLWTIAPELSGLDDWAVDVDTNMAADGFVAVVGTVDNSDAGTGLDMWLQMYDANGRILWETQYDSPASGNDLAAGVVIDTANEVTIVGTEDRPDLGTGRDIFIAKFDAEGQRLWSGSVSTPADDVATGIDVAPLLQLYVSGYQTTPPADTSWWLGRFEPEGGDPVWTATYAGAAAGNFTITRGVASDLAGNAIAIGREVSEAQGVDALSRKYGPSGELVGSVAFDIGMGADEEGHGVATDFTNSIVLVGDVPSSAGTFRDAWIRKLTAAGDETWVQIYDSGFGFDESATAVAIGPDDHIVVAGTEFNGTDTDLWVMRIEP